MAEYIFTNLPQYIRITPRSDFSNSVVAPNHLLLFSEDGETITAKNSDGNFIQTGGTDVSDTTATAATVLSGYDFYLADGTKASGTIQTVTASVSGNVVTVPDGYIASSQTLTIGTAVASQTITPGTTDQTIAADSYLTGATTIKGDANLVAANIADGVTIFGVLGTHKGSSNFYKCATVQTTSLAYNVSGAGNDSVNGIYTDTGLTYQGQPVYSMNNGSTTWYLFFVPGNYWCIHTEYEGVFSGLTEVVYYLSTNGITGTYHTQNKGTDPAPTVTEVSVGGAAWTGYKAVQNSSTGAWSFESTVTSGLLYTAFIPQIGKIYDEHATVEAVLYT